MNIPDKMTSQEYQFFIKNGYLPNQSINRKHNISNKRQNPEHDLQVWFCQELDKNNIFYFAVPNGNLRKKSVARMLKAEGVKAGVADIVVVVKDAVIFVEMKAGKQGKQQPSQKEFEKKVKSLGHNYIILRDQKECLEFIDAITNVSDIDIILEKNNKK
jgi:hypothetical protein